MGSASQARGDTVWKSMILAFQGQRRKLFQSRAESWWGCPLRGSTYKRGGLQNLFPALALACPCQSASCCRSPGALHLPQTMAPGQPLHFNVLCAFVWGLSLCVRGRGRDDEVGDNLSSLKADFLKNLFIKL